MTETGFALTAAGDLNGTGRWTFTTDGPEVVISYDWRVSATKPLLQPVELAAQAGVLGQSSLGHGPR